MNGVHTLGFDRFGDAVEGSCERLVAASELAARVGAADPGALVALPAGFVQTEDEGERDRWAAALCQASRQSQVALAFGIDLLEEEHWGIVQCPRSYLYLCDRGRPLIWGVRCREGDYEARRVALGAAPLLVLLGRELFEPRALRAAARLGPELVLVLSHGAPTHKWTAPLAALDALAPTLVVHGAAQPRRPLPARHAPSGWTMRRALGPLGHRVYQRQRLVETRSVA